MINRNQAIEIAEDFLKTELEKESWFLKVRPHVKAFILYGSMVKEVNKPDSDIDVMIILPLEQEKKYTKGEYFYDYQGEKVNIVLRSIEKLRKIVSEKKDLFQKEIFRKSKVLMDNDGEVSDLLKEISKINNYATEFLGKSVTVKIDRPINSKHPKHGFVYEVNYGLVLGTKAPDGEEIDAYLLGVNESVKKFTGKCIAIIHRADDDDDKLVIVPENAKDMSDEQILKAVNFQEKWFNSMVIR